MKLNLWIPPANGEKFNTAVEKHNAIAESYEAQYDTLYWKLYDDMTWEYMEKDIIPFAKGRLLDAGGGTGRWAREFAKRGFIVDVVDLADEMRRVGEENAKNEKLEDKITFQRGDVCEIPFDDEVFDAVICQGNPVSYCKDPYKAISELARVAKKGAPVVISVHNKLAMIHYFGFFMGKITIDQALEMADTSKVTIDYPIKAFTPDELCRVCEENGLKVNQLIGKPTITGYVQSESYLSILGDPEGYAKALELERKYCTDPSIMGFAGHLQISCTKK